VRRAIATLPAFAALVAGCHFPDDQSGTLERISASHTIRVGYTGLEPGDEAPASAFLARIERATGAHTSTNSGPVERQLAALEDGQLDLVIGEFAEDSPWLDSVAVIEPIQQRTVGERTIGLAPVAANGENRWVALLEKAVRDGRPRA
jgi:hypothetical protein